ncbi:MAG: hypothetical protein K8F90_00460 [Hyphomicrobiales bacterium]|nr:hypothetical protein [Hyphomicrobiales bacterium]
MNPDDFDDRARASLSLLQVYRLIALEQIEMDRRVAERRAANVVPLKARARASREIRLEPDLRRRLAG